MGISGLLPLLKDIQVQGNISAFRGQRLAVDAYVWLHKGAFGCAEDLVKGKKTTRFVDYAMHRVRLLRHHGITPFIVFDGGPLPAKKGTENSRAKSRAENLAKAAALESQSRLREAKECYTKCVDITPEMAYQLIKALRAENVDYIVAPYEADAQLYFLEREGFVDGIITEDSDLLVFGCKQVIFKLDNNGQCIWIHRDKLATVREFPMHGWTDMQFRRMAMLSGCDYLPSIAGIGIKTAHRLLRRHKTVEKLLQAVRLDGAMPVPPDYLASFAQAELAFLHQRVFDPTVKRLIPLNDFPQGGLKEEDEKWIGLDLDVHLARGLARGDLHPETLLPIEDQWPEYKPVGIRPSSAAGGPSETILGESSKANIVAGPMDAFVSRSRLKPAPLPKPVGVLGSGVSRLSDQPSGYRSPFPKQSEPVLKDQHDAISKGGIKKSKFFSRSRNSRHIEPSYEDSVGGVVELVWEKSDDVSDIEDDHPVAGPSRSPRSPSGDESVRSPSPVISSLRAESSPARAFPGTEGMHLTSPASGRMSSPAFSSPRSFDPFSPPPKLARPRSASPSSPSRSRPNISAVQLIGRSSQGLQPTQSIRSSQIMSDQTPTKRKRLDRSTSSLTSVLVPVSSPGGPKAAVPFSRDEDFDPRQICRLGESSSDSIEDDLVVTPSAEVIGKRGANAYDQEDQEGEAQRRRDERAQAVAAGWKEKYAFNTEIAFPRSGPAKKPKPRRTTSDSPQTWPTRRQPVRADTIPVALGERPINVPVETTIKRQSPPSERKPKTYSPVTAFNPQGLSRAASSLEKYRFTKKITMDQYV